VYVVSNGQLEMPACTTEWYERLNSKSDMNWRCRTSVYLHTQYNEIRELRKITKTLLLFFEN